jgi:BlaI family penicillinase repressor
MGERLTAFYICSRIYYCCRKALNMKLTESEWQIMNALWQQHPATARELAERLPAEVKWAYTTIKTMLTRLVTKKAVSERKRANTSLYEPLVSRDKARRSAMRSLLDQAFEGAVEPMLDFLADDRKLTKKQRRQLLALLQEEEAKKEEAP